MNRLRAILLPTDFSAAASAIAPEICELAGRFGARVTLLHAFDLAPDYAVPPHDVPHHGPLLRIPPYTPELRELRGQRLRRLQEFADREFAAVPHSACLEDGDPATVIEWAANREAIDLIAMPTRGHGRFRRLLLGSVTAKVLHDTACAVWTDAHRDDPARRRGGSYGSILCAIEMNWEAGKILDAACLFARTYDARLSVVHLDSEEDVSARLEIGQVLQHYATGRTNAEVRLLDASVAEGIQRAAVEERADLVVVGRGHERQELSRMWSPLYDIIRASPCAVLSV